MSELEIAQDKLPAVMSEFELTKDKLPAIAEKLKVDEALIDDFFPVFQAFCETIREQHLAHIIRAMELLIREKNKNPSFIIDWKPMPKGETTKTSVSLKWPNKYGIVIPAELANGEDLIKLRVHVAHELGHLFYITHYPENKSDRTLNHKMAHVFGAFVMLERNKFYKEKAPQMCRKTWGDVITDFVQLDNREQEK